MNFKVFGPKTIHCLRADDGQRTHDAFHGNRRACRGNHHGVNRDANHGADHDDPDDDWKIGELTVCCLKSESCGEHILTY